MKQIISLRNTRHIVVVAGDRGVKINAFKTKDDAYLNFIKLISTGSWKIARKSSTITVAKLEGTNTTVTMRSQYQESDFNKYMDKRNYKPVMTKGNKIIYKHKKNPYLYARVDVAKHKIKYIDIRYVR